MKKNKLEKAFTLIELLVVIAIISVLSTIVFAAIDPNDIISKLEDNKRFDAITKLSKALELYKLDNGHYPEIDYVETYTEAGVNKTEFETALAPYMTIDLSEDTWGHYSWVHITSFFYYSPSVDGHQSYGAAIDLRHPDNAIKETEDGGSIDGWYEIGPNPTYCKIKYGWNSISEMWTHNYGHIKRCVGGN